MDITELAEQTRQGDEKAFSLLCRQFTGLVKRYAWQSHVRSIAEEAEAEGWLAVVRAVRNFDAKLGVPLAGYVESQVKFAVWNLFKRERRRWQRETVLEKLAAADEEEKGHLLERLPGPANVSAEVEDSLFAGVLAGWLAGLPERQRQVIAATLLEGRQLTAVARELGITAQAVHNLRRRGLARLKRAYEGMYGSERG
ncbi:RNA polymerase sigma factor [Propionispora hippei]|uniref:Sigma-70, region 4 n=1 Tax=Propionispora hippei DSM 15287 TaxID=1123003 RepID=A0A1M6K0Q3_9FIRM|nr:sigma-70 family RNA polymerase sigma factor [Propionispora hippei]SHJ52422.1 Sigma-70, region 4 [Propionispora hippei DSM 15287]